LEKQSQNGHKAVTQQVSNSQPSQTIHCLTTATKQPDNGHTELCYRVQVTWLLQYIGLDRIDQPTHMEVCSEVLATRVPYIRMAVESDGYLIDTGKIPTPGNYQFTCWPGLAGLLSSFDRLPCSHQ